MWNVQNPDTPQERKCTNISSLFFCGGFVIIMLILVSYGAINGNIDRLIKGYDDCGNICGLNNPSNHFNNCGTHDKVAFPKVLINESKRGNLTINHYECVDKCPKNYEEIFNRCWKNEGKNDTDDDVEKVKIGSVFQEIAQDLISTWPQIALICLIAFIFSYILLMLFRYAIKYVIWIIYISFVLVLAAGAIAFWILYAKAKEKDNRTGAMITAIILTVFTLLAVLVLYLFRRRIQLVAELFKEASRALIDVPTILFEPILTFISLILAFVPFVFFTIMIQTAGNLTEGKAMDGKFQATYQPNGAMIAALVLNFIGFIWFTQFIFGCQHFVIAGTISKWYFARDKTKLDSPVLTTFSHLLNFHLGSVCLGSMIITLVKIIRMIVNGIQNQLRESGSPVAQFFACFCGWIIQQIEELLKYLIRNSYIIVAKDGTPLIESGKRAFNLIFRNLVDVIALNNFGDLVLVIGRLFVVAIAGFIGYQLLNKPTVNLVFVPLIISLVFAFLIAHCFVSVFEMTVDTIFICFCEDCEENDGFNRPYYMSEGLKKIMCELKETAGGQFNFGNLNNSGVEGGQSLGHNQPPYPTH